MKKPAVTVLIPAYRSGERLLRTLESIAQQTYAPTSVELSFDAAPGYEPPPLPEVPGLHVRHQPQRLGWVAHVNFLLESVDTPYFMLLYHDDTISPGYIAAAIAALEADPAAAVAHGSVRNHGLRSDVLATESIRGDPVERVREFLRRGPTSAELGQRGVIRAGVLASGAHLRTRRSDGMLSNTLWSLELLFSGDSINCDGQYYDKFLDPDGLSRLYHGRNREERSRMLSESVASFATILAERGVQDPQREQLLRDWTLWLLGLQGPWNVLADEPSSDLRTVAEVRLAFAGFVADLASSLVTPARR
jgi:glycosyltransferase involved in cell wall biosynthesis